VTVWGGYTFCMKRLIGMVRVAAAVTLLPVMLVQQSFAWGADGHRMINRLAAAALPTDVPAFLRNGEALDTMEYLGPEPDRWKNRAENELLVTQSPDHFIDMEWADYADVSCTAGQNGCPASGKDLPRLRYDFFRAVEKAAAAHPELNLTPEKIGFQPWEVQEIYERLKVGLREYRKLVAANQDTKPVETAILFYAGWLGHYVGDGSQPLHDTIQYNGWTGPNPNGYTTEHKIHAQFETMFVMAAAKPADVAPLVAAAKPKVLNDEWADYMEYLRHSNSLVEKTYQLEKAGGFNGTGTPESVAFLDERLAAGAIELRDLIYTAWVKSGDPVQEYHGPQ
jgi:hypothetical protein